MSVELLFKNGISNDKVSGPDRKYSDRALGYELRQDLFLVRNAHLLDNHQTVRLGNGLHLSSPAHTNRKPI